MSEDYTDIEPTRAQVDALAGATAAPAPASLPVPGAGSPLPEAPLPPGDDPWANTLPDPLVPATLSVARFIPNMYLSVTSGAA